MEAFIQDYLQAKDRGGSPEEVMQLMHQKGLTIIEAIKTFMAVYKISLGEAKEKVAASPLWADVVKAAEPLHDQLATSITKYSAYEEAVGG